MQDRNAVYDEQIAPLVSQIIALCEEHGIPVVMEFQLTETDSGLEDATFCSSSYIPDGACDYMRELEVLVMEGEV